MNFSSHAHINKIFNLFKWLLVTNFRRGHHRLWRSSFSALFFILILILPFSGKYLNYAEVFPVAGHAAMSFDLAVNKALCHKTAAISYLYSPGINQAEIKSNTYIPIIPASTTLVKNKVSFNTSISHIPLILANSTEEYCKTVTHPVINNENSFMYILSSILQIKPDITIATLVKTLIALKIACIAFFIFTLLRFGFSPLLGGALFFFALVILHEIHQGQPLSVYSLLLPVALVFTALIALVLDMNLHRFLIGAVASGFLIGFYGGFFYNLRSSYLPIILFGFILYLGFALYDVIAKHKTIKTQKMLFVVLSSCLLIFGFNIFNRTFITPLSEVNGNNNRVYHVVAHPLVLSLALPENKLSIREGIKWEDGIGLNLARKIDPSVKFLDSNYESALLTYYMKLWFYHPSEMLNIYIKKSDISVDLYDYVTKYMSGSVSHFLSFLIFPLKNIHGGIIYTLLLLCATLVVFKKRTQWNTGIVLSFILLFGMAIFITIESILIMPYFLIAYHSILMFTLLILVLNLYQLLLNGILNSQQMVAKFCRSYNFFKRGLISWKL